MLDFPNPISALRVVCGQDIVSVPCKMSPCPIMKSNITHILSNLRGCQTKISELVIELFQCVGFCGQFEKVEQFRPSISPLEVLVDVIHTVSMLSKRVVRPDARTNTQMTIRNKEQAGIIWKNSLQFFKKEGPRFIVLTVYNCYGYWINLAISILGCSQQQNSLIQSRQVRTINRYDL